MGTVRIFPAPVSGVRLADAVTVFLGTIPAANTRRGYGVVLNRLVADTPRVPASGRHDSAENPCSIV